jgi:type II secretory pathway component PulF
MATPDPPPVLDYGNFSRPRMFDRPAFVAAIVIALQITMFETWLVPKFQDIFKDFHARLPPSTDFALHTAAWFMRGGWIAVAALPIAAPFIIAAIRRGRPPTKRSIRLSIRACTLFFVLLAGYFAVTFGQAVILLTTTVPEK